MGLTRYINAIYQYQSPDIIVDNTLVQYASEIKYLSITISSTLSWDKHITNTTNKIRRTFYQLKLCKSLHPRGLRERLVITLIFPHLDYCCYALTNVTAEQNLRLYRAINACVRFILDIRRDQHITPHYKTLRWLNVNDRRRYFVGCLLHIILMTQQPYSIYVNLHRREESVRDTRAPDNDLVSPLCRTEIFRQSFMATAIRIWNDIPLNIRRVRTHDLFKSLLYGHLLDNI
ncbi:uncharacterized protein LOC109860626 [Pseudomyrmex gracilis]|uniref:uncharacterized protein LOC109860626 n=1 Tax=Pseudomyrmex gracilis TaxID=219809 RepID=UPI0009958340|nr:uncharacterized protein LOC109860626 [Pseudomyrmex gracilis]